MCSHRTRTHVRLSRAERDQLRRQAATADRDDDHRVDRRRPTLRGRARIEDPEVLEPLELRHVRVAVDDRRAIRKAGRETSLPARPRAGVVDQADAGAFDLHRVLVGAGLLIQSLMNLRGQYAAMRPETVLTMRTVLSRGKYSQQSQRLSFYKQVLDRVRTLPGVLSAERRSHRS